MNSPDSEFQRISPQKRRCSREEFWLHAKSPKRESSGWNALWAQPSDLLKLITEQGVKIVGLGFVVGVSAAPGLAFGPTKLLRDKR